MQACDKLLQKNLIPFLIAKDNISHQLRGIASLRLKMSGLNIKLPSDIWKFLELAIKTSSVLDTYDTLTATPSRKKSIQKLKYLKLKENNKKELTFLLT